MLQKTTRFIKALIKGACTKASLAFMITLSASTTVLAGLPKAPAGAGVAADDFLGNLKYWIGAGAAILILAVCLMAFTSAGSALLTRFNDWNKGRDDLGTLITVAVIGFVLIVMIIILATQASTIFPSTAGQMA